MEKKINMIWMIRLPTDVTAKKLTVNTLSDMATKNIWLERNEEELYPYVDCTRIRNTLGTFVLWILKYLTCKDILFYCQMGLTK